MIEIKNGVLLVNGEEALYLDDSTTEDAMKAVRALADHNRKKEEQKKNTSV